MTAPSFSFPFLPVIGVILSFPSICLFLWCKCLHLCGFLFCSHVLVFVLQLVHLSQFIRLIFKLHNWSVLFIRCIFIAYFLLSWVCLIFQSVCTIGVFPDSSSTFCLMPDSSPWVIIGTHLMITVCSLQALTVMLETVVVLCSDIILVCFHSLICISLSISSAFFHTCCSCLFFSCLFFSLVFHNSSSIFC